MRACHRACHLHRQRLHMPQQRLFRENGFHQYTWERLNHIQPIQQNVVQALQDTCAKLHRAPPTAVSVRLDAVCTVEVHTKELCLRPLELLIKSKTTLQGAVLGDVAAIWNGPHSENAIFISTKKFDTSKRGLACLFNNATQSILPVALEKAIQTTRMAHVLAPFFMDDPTSAHWLDWAAMLAFCWGWTRWDRWLSLMKSRIMGHPVLSAHANVFSTLYWYAGWTCSHCYHRNVSKGDIKQRQVGSRLTQCEDCQGDIKSSCHSPQLTSIISRQFSARDTEFNCSLSAFITLPQGTSVCFG